MFQFLFFEIMLINFLLSLLHWPSFMAIFLGEDDFNPKAKNIVHSCQKERQNFPQNTFFNICDLSLNLMRVPPRRENSSLTLDFLQFYLPIY